MTDLVSHLERLGLEQYLDAFIGEGFDTWETLCDIQESDLQTLGVKLGHRRKLQRAIAEHRGISYERFFNSPVGQEGGGEPSRSETSITTITGKEGASGPPTEAKRKYRRHPKPDENAPEKPPSAYVLFSNKVREEVKSENLSFTEIAKLVGDRWQKLESSQKDPYESQATTLKEQYNVKLSAYKKTESYKEYMQYLSDFKAKHGAPTEPKRPKLDPQSSGGSVSAASVEMPDTVQSATGHGRLGSISSIGGVSQTSALTSPTAAPLSSVSVLPGMPGASSRNLPTLPRPNSPPYPQHRDIRLLGQLSSQSSMSDDSGPVSYDSLSRTAKTLSLNTPPSNTPPLSTHTLGIARSDQMGQGDAFPWSSRIGQSIHPATMPNPAGPSPLASSITLPSPTFPNEQWRDRGIDWSRQAQISPVASGAGQAPVVPLPPLLGPDRISELSHNQVQRTLPPLRHTASGPTPITYQGTTPTSQAPHLGSVETERRFSHGFEGGVRQLDRHENEAASTLAGLAARPDGNDTPLSRSHARRRPG